MNKKVKKLLEIKEEIEILERQKQHLKQKIAIKRESEERKKRTRRLIETGALAEKYFELHDLTISEREELFKMFSAFINANKPKKFKKNKPEN